VEKRLKTGGRKKGSRNKFTVSAKEAFQKAFDATGGAVALAEWASDNRTEFYKLFSRLIPTEVNGPDDGPVQVLHKIERIIVRPDAPT